MTPASTHEALTAAVALDVLGPVTPASARRSSPPPRPVDGVVAGDLAGRRRRPGARHRRLPRASAPAAVFTALEALADRLVAAGVRRRRRRARRREPLRPQRYPDGWPARYSTRTSRAVARAAVNDGFGRSRRPPQRPRPRPEAAGTPAARPPRCSPGCWRSAAWTSSVLLGRAWRRRGRSSWRGGSPPLGEIVARCCARATTRPPSCSSRSSAAATGGPASTTGGAAVAEVGGGLGRSAPAVVDGSGLAPRTASTCELLVGDARPRPDRGRRSPRACRSPARPARSPPVPSAPPVEGGCGPRPAPSQWPPRRHRRRRRPPL